MKKLSGGTVEDQVFKVGPKEVQFRRRGRTLSLPFRSEMHLEEFDNQQHPRF